MCNDNERLYERLLVVCCQTGDDDAYRELIGRFGPRLRYYLLKLVGRIDRADDLAQEVWIDVLRQLHRLKDAAAFTTWLYRIAHGKAMLEARRNGRAHATISDPNLIEARQEENFSAEDAARIHAMLDQLETTHREVLVLRFLEDLSYEEIGEVLGCPIGTVRSRLHYAKSQLKTLLEAHR